MTSIAQTSAHTGWLEAELNEALCAVKVWHNSPEKPAALVWPSTLELLASLFDLTSFEAELLWLCAATELDPSLPRASFGLGLSKLRMPHWSACAPDAPLRHWNLLSLEPAQSLVASPLRIDERILHFLTGVDTLDPVLASYLTPLEEGGELPPTQNAHVEYILRWWAHDGRPEPVQLAGGDAHAKRDVAARVCTRSQWRGYVWPVETLPNTEELSRLWRRWQREALLSRAILVLDAERVESSKEQPAVERLLERSSGPVFVCVRQRWPLRLRDSLTCEVGRPTRDEQRSLWKEQMPSGGVTTEDEVRSLVAHFDLPLHGIRAAAGLWRAGASNSLWNSCREYARTEMSGAAQRIEPRVRWNDLILPEGWKSLLRMIAAQVRCRGRVYEDWQAAERTDRGLGITALFAGPSGTGKSLAAEVIAGELQLDLCRVDLSQVVSKYIGETEKNIARVCEAAEQGGAVLLFDEADALFGKRSEVKDSHDRHANIEVSYLLQRMEAYKGLAILTTNLSENIDPAFLRRLRFIVNFPLPEAEERQAIWARMFPAKAPLQGIDFARLAQLQISGGLIRNISLLAMFLAAERDTPVTMPCVLEASRIECAKLDRPLRPAEVEGWQ